MDPSTNTSAALSDRAAALLERLAADEEARARQRLLDRPRRLHAELYRRWQEAVNQRPVSRTMVQRTEEGLAILDEHCQAMRVTVSNADRIAAEVSQAMEFVREAEELARQAHRLPAEELVARCRDLAVRAGIDLQD